jgi:fibronectin type 3 domain-containing protein
MITVDMTKAREIKRDQLRAERRPLLEQLDVQFMRAQEQGDQTKADEIAARKQALRDVTADPAIDAATTPDELKAVRPAILDEETE